MAPTLYGPDGRPIRRQALRVEQGGPTVTGIRSILADHPSEGLTPATIGRLLRDAEAGSTRAYLDLAADIEEKFVQYRAALATRKGQVAELELTVEAHSDDRSDQVAANLVREVLDQPEVSDWSLDLLDAISKGFSACEILWDLSGRDWRPLSLVRRDPRWFRIDPIDGATLRLEDGSPDGEDLHPYKWVVHRPKLTPGPMIRAGLARPAAWLYLFRAFGWRDWLAFIETYGHPIRVGKYGPGASEEDKGVLLRALRNVARDFAASIPEDMVVEFVQSSAQGASQELYNALLDRVDRETSKLVLGQTTTMDAISGGHAVSREHRLVQEDIERADARQLAGTLTRQLVRPLVYLNLGPPPHGHYPQVRIGRPEVWDAQTMMPAIKTFVDMGGTVEASVIRDRLGLPDPPEGDDVELLTAPGRSTDPEPGQPPAADPRAEAAARQLTALLTAARARPADPLSASLDHLSDRALDDWRSLVDPLVDPILATLDRTDSPQAMLAALDALAGEDLVAALRARLAAVIGTADAAGDGGLGDWVDE